MINNIIIFNIDINVIKNNIINIINIVINITLILYFLILLL